ncbi:cysteine-rich CWC family protein [Bacterioplanoides sp.]|uniref:cysteine-rich CWC family protein n=1 Tax=Bacterioplanoides sp. TaxID=2066072 RepID=UPI003AFFF53F
MMELFHKLAGTVANIGSDCCPLCGEKNQCVMTQPGYQNPKDCWCMQLDERIPEELLEQVPARYRGKNCICQACLQRYWSGETP